MFEYRGALHVHTTYSDGFGTVAEVLARARAAGVHFLAVTDHDCLDAAERPGAGWHDGVLLIVGNEISPPENHYLTFGLSHTPDRSLPPSVYVPEVTAAGGFGFVAHPYDRGNRVLHIKGYPWTAGEHIPFEGIEVWNLGSHLLSRARNVGLLLLALVLPGLFLRSPEQNVLAMWDRLGQQRQVPGIGGVDAHGWKGWLGRSRLLLLDYRAMFSTLQTRVILPSPLGGHDSDIDAILAALRQGQCYICNASLGDPQGFMFSGRDADGVHLLGSEVTWRQGLHLTAVVPRQADVRLLRNGELVARERTQRLEWPVSTPGVYRVEVWRPGLFGPQVWVLSNPIYVR